MRDIILYIKNSTNKNYVIFLKISTYLFSHLTDIDHDYLYTGTDYDIETILDEHRTIKQDKAGNTAKKNENKAWHRA